MKLLLDANISWRIAAKLKNHFEDCLHVDKIGLAFPGEDMEIYGLML
jgi:predicted nuclease of predicted toxin-antitoxin system